MREKAEKTLCDNARFRSVCGTFNPTFHGYSSGISDEKCRAFFDGTCTVYRADNRRAYIDHALSSSYSRKEADERFAAYVQALGEIFDRYAVAGHITVPTDTVAYIGKV